jgi:hypothetical protein
LFSPRKSARPPWWKLRCGSSRICTTSGGGDGEGEGDEGEGGGGEGEGGGGEGGGVGVGGGGEGAGGGVGVGGGGEGAGGGGEGKGGEGKGGGGEGGGGGGEGEGGGGEGGAEGGAEGEGTVRVSQMKSCELPDGRGCSLLLHVWSSRNMLWAYTHKDTRAYTHKDTRAYTHTDTGIYTQGHKGIYTQGHKGVHTRAAHLTALVRREARGGRSGRRQVQHSSGAREQRGGGRWGRVSHVDASPWKLLLPAATRPHRWKPPELSGWVRALAQQPAGGVLTLYQGKSGYGPHTLAHGSVTPARKPVAVVGLNPPQWSRLKAVMAPPHLVCAKSLAGSAGPSRLEPSVQCQSEAMGHGPAPGFAGVMVVDSCTHTRTHGMVPR